MRDLSSRKAWKSGLNCWLSDRDQTASKKGYRLNFRLNRQRSRYSKGTICFDDVGEQIDMEGVPIQDAINSMGILELFESLEIPEVRSVVIIAYTRASKSEYLL